MILKPVYTRMRGYPDDFVTRWLIEMQLEQNPRTRRQMVEGIGSTLDKRGGVLLWCRDEDGWTWQEGKVIWSKMK